MLLYAYLMKGKVKMLVKINQKLSHASNSTEFISNELKKEVLNSIYKQQNQETIQQESL